MAARVQLKKAGLLTKVVVLVLIIIASIALLRMRSQIAEAEQAREVLRLQVADQAQVNAELREAVGQSDDPQRQEDIVRNELGLAAPGERVIIFTD